MTHILFIKHILQVGQIVDKTIISDITDHYLPVKLRSLFSSCHMFIHVTTLPWQELEEDLWQRLKRLC